MQSIRPQMDTKLWRCSTIAKPDLVITDVKMPMMNGIELSKRLLAISKDVPIIIVTAFGTVKDAVEAIKLGASNYITKPNLGLRVTVWVNSYLL